MRQLALACILLAMAACTADDAPVGGASVTPVAITEASPIAPKAVDLSSFRPKATYPPSYYQGPLFDTHLHQFFLLPGSRPLQLTPESWLNLMDTYGIGAVIAFISLTPESVVASAGRSQVAGPPAQGAVGGVEDCRSRVLGRALPPPPTEEELQRIRQECGAQSGAAGGPPGVQPGQQGQMPGQAGQASGQPGQMPAQPATGQQKLPSAQEQQAFLESLDGILQALEGRVLPMLFPKAQVVGGDLLLRAGWEEFVAGVFTREFVEPFFAPGRFRGFGELGFYQARMVELSPSDPQFHVVYPFVAASDGVIMWHPRDSMTIEDFRVIGEYPQIKFLFHGMVGDLESLIVPLLERYPNVYFTLDVSSVAQFKGPTLYYGKGAWTLFFDEKTTPALRAKIEQLGGMQATAERVRDRFGWLLQAYPDRIMWGTDIAPPHFWQQEGFIGVMVEWSRLFISLLPPEVQEAYAYKNAQRVFGHLLTSASRR